MVTIGIPSQVTVALELRQTGAHRSRTWQAANKRNEISDWLLVILVKGRQIQSELRKTWPCRTLLILWEVISVHAIPYLPARGGKPVRRTDGIGLGLPGSPCICVCVCVCLHRDGYIAFTG